MGFAEAVIRKILKLNDERVKCNAFLPQALQFHRIVIEMEPIAGQSTWTTPWSYVVGQLTKVDEVMRMLPSEIHPRETPRTAALVHAGAATPASVEDDTFDALAHLLLDGLPPSGEVRLATALPTASRQNLVVRALVPLLARLGRKAWPIEEATHVGQSDRDDGSICQLIHVAAGKSVGSRLDVPVLVESAGQPVLVVNGFMPPAGDRHAWQDLQRFLKQLRVRTSIVLIQAANPYHDQALMAGSVPLDLRARRLGLPEASRDDASSRPADLVFRELPPCCQGVLASARFADRTACVGELVEAGILRRDGDVVAPARPEWQESWRVEAQRAAETRPGPS
jgi:hypothetical protein